VPWSKTTTFAHCHCHQINFLPLLPLQHCEDIHRGKFQQCHEPIWNSTGTKSTQGHSTRPPHKVTFSQSGPTTIRPDLNTFSAWLCRSPRPDRYTMAHAACFNGLQALAHRLATRTFSPHILTGLGSIFQNQPKIAQVTSVIFIMKGPKISQTSKISWADQLTRLLRFGSFDPILVPTLV